MMSGDARSCSRVRSLPWLLVCLSVVIPTTAQAAPTIGNIGPRGLKLGATTTLTIDGAELGAETRILSDAPIQSQALRDGAADHRIQIDVTLAADVAPGLYTIRLANARGVSAAVILGVDALDQLPLAAEVASLPVALHGALSGSQIVSTRFAGSAGHRIVLDVEARRLGANFTPLVRLLDPQGKQVAWNQANPAIAGDARLDVQLPATGSYTIEICDALYRADAPGHFRLRLGDLPYADFTLPLAVQRGAASPVSLLGSMAQTPAADLTANEPLSSLPAPLPVGFANFSGPRPAVRVSDFPEHREAPPGDGSLQSLSAPAGVTGLLAAGREEDRYRFNVQPGAAVRVDVLAQRVGSPLDGVVTVHTEQGAELGRSDDRPGTADPGLDVNVPADVSAIVVSVRDLLSRGGERFVYRLAVTAAAEPDFSLAVDEDRFHVAQGGATLLRVRVNRSGYAGPIALDLAPAFAGVAAPSGLVLEPREIPAHVSEALLSFRAGEAAVAQGAFRLVGSAEIPGRSQPLVRVAQLPETPATRLQGWMRSSLAAAITGPAPFSVVWQGSADDRLPVASSFAAPIEVKRAPGVSGAVRLSLLTTQAVPTKNVNNQQVPDLARALRVDGTPTIAADATTTELTIQVPGDLPEMPYDLVVVAELLSADGAQVLARSVTPARRLSPARPAIRLELAGEPKVQAAAGTGPTGVLKGRVVRLAGFDGEVRLSLAGLPAEYFAPSVTIPAEREEFEYPIHFSYGAAPAELAGVKLAATGLFDDGAELPGMNTIDLAVKIVPGEPPPALYPVFEDEAYFPGLISEGNPPLVLERVQRVSGGASLKAMSLFRFRTRLPLLGLKIRQNPGPGEYRFLTFAWKSPVGRSVSLHLATNGGAFGPNAGQDRPAFRYSAGIDPRGLKVIQISPQMPSEWQVVTRDLFADFGEFTLDGLGFMVGDGETPATGDYSFFDRIYLAKAEADLAGCPAAIQPEKPAVLFEDEATFAQELSEGGGAATLVPEDKFSGVAGLRISGDQKLRTAVPGWAFKVRENPGPGEYRYMQFAWRKQGGARIAIQLNHDGLFGPLLGRRESFRYDAGTGPESYGAALRVDDKLPGGWTVVTRDLYADFGEFTLSGIAFSPQDGEYGMFDQILLGRTPRDFELAK